MSLTQRRRARALRTRFTSPEFVPTGFGSGGPRHGAGIRAIMYQDLHPFHANAQENAQLHKTARAAADDARGMERLMERKRWSAG